jgi:prolyl oligopeptidase PreP (S9A serine peptidase family)
MFVHPSSVGVLDTPQVSSMSLPSNNEEEMMNYMNRKVLQERMALAMEIMLQHDDSSKGYPVRIARSEKGYVYAKVMELGEYADETLAWISSESEKWEVALQANSIARTLLDKEGFPYLSEEQREALNAIAEFLLTMSGTAREEQVLQAMDLADEEWRKYVRILLDMLNAP